MFLFKFSKLQDFVKCLVTVERMIIHLKFYIESLQWHIICIQTYIYMNIYLLAQNIINNLLIELFTNTTDVEYL